MSLEQMIKLLRRSHAEAGSRRRQDSLHWAVRNPGKVAPIGVEVTTTLASMSLSNIAAPDDDAEYTTAEQLALANRLHDFRLQLQQGDGLPVFIPRDGLA